MCLEYFEKNNLNPRLLKSTLVKGSEAVHLPLNKDIDFSYFFKVVLIN
jgi:hypothetical protein